MNTLTPEPTLAADGMKYSLAYRYNRRNYAVTVYADDWEDAERHAEAIRANGYIDGKVIAEIPVNAATWPFAGMLLRIVMWWKTR